MSASNIKPFSSYAQKTTWGGGGTKCPPPGQLGLKPQNMMEDLILLLAKLVLA